MEKKELKRKKNRKVLHIGRTFFFFRQEVKLYSFAPIEQNDSLTESTIIHDLKVIVTVGECDSPVFIKESIRYSQVKITKYFSIIFHYNKK